MIVLFLIKITERSILNASIDEKDVLLTVVVTLGRVAIVDDNRDKFAVQRSVAIIRTDEKQFDPQFCFQSFRRPVSKAIRTGQIPLHKQEFIREMAK